MNKGNQQKGVKRRHFLGLLAGGAAAVAADANIALAKKERTPAVAHKRQPNILFVMTDQQRADTIAALGNGLIHTPNLDRLVARGVSFTNAYSTCPVCIPARLTIRTGREPLTTGCFGNEPVEPWAGAQAAHEERCGAYLARTLRGLGYRTFGIGKFHATPAWDADLGYDVHLHSEELYGTPDQRSRDAYAAFIREQHPALDYVEGLMGERTEMYYMPQMSAQPASATVEGWAATRAVEQIQAKDDRPYFGFVSFIGPHPPCAPPIPFNRMYDPDRMPNPVRGDATADLMDEQIRWMNYAIWAEDINDSHARVLKSRYYGEISYIDHCLGRILDAVEARGDAENTLICFFADHGDHLGDHHGWQKESYFDVACRVPFLVSWPASVQANVRHNDLVCLTDLFGIATHAAGKTETRDGTDVLGMLAGKAKPRERLFGYYGSPGTSRFKVMTREGDWKYIFMANGDREQLFNIKEDPMELRQRLQDEPAIAGRLRAAAAKTLTRPGVNAALDAQGGLRVLPYDERPRQRFYQYDQSRGVFGFPKNPADALKGFSL